MNESAENIGRTAPDAPAGTALRRGWTTGACATAAAKAAATALLSGAFSDPVTIRLPRGQTPAFALCRTDQGDGWARASIIKDAGDDPDVTHGAEIVATVFLQKGSEPANTDAVQAGEGIFIAAGAGVGTVTLAGLPVAPGEPAVNPVPRRMIAEALADVAAEYGVPPAFVVELSIPDGEAIAVQTWNPRLGIVGGLSILGTTGIVTPYSCAAWIDAIHRGVDVARAAGIGHVVGATGRGSEQAAQAHYDLDLLAMIDMGDFAGGLLKYVRAHPVDRLTIAGGFAKITKLAQGALDLHSARSQVDLEFLAQIAGQDIEPAEARHHLARAIGAANTAAEALAIAGNAGVDLATPIAGQAVAQARAVLREAEIAINVLVVARDGTILAETAFA